MGQKSFFPPNNWCCPVLPLLPSMHKPPIIGEDNVLHVTDSPKKHSPQLNPPSPNPLLGKGSTCHQVVGSNACDFFFFRVLALLERCEFVSFWALSTLTTVLLKS
jgi:hypothetical protein